MVQDGEKWMWMSVQPMLLYLKCIVKDKKLGKQENIPSQILGCLLTQKANCIFSNAVLIWNKSLDIKKIQWGCDLINQWFQLLFFTFTVGWLRAESDPDYSNKFCSVLNTLRIFYYATNFIREKKPFEIILCHF